MPIHNPLHPGKIIYETLIKGASLSITDAAEHLDVTGKIHIHPPPFGRPPLVKGVSHQDSSNPNNRTSGSNRT
jgi:hypothetical protein